MKQENHLLRAARNTLLDMLLESRGTTFPLADLPASTPDEMVCFNEAGTIRIDYNQPDVNYQVFESGKPYSEVYQPKNRQGILLTTNKLDGESHAFTVIATKRYPAEKETPLSKVLYKVVNIKVGVNKGLEVTAAKTQVAFNEKNSLTVKNPQKEAIYYVSCFIGGNNVPLSAEVVCEGGDQLTIGTTDGLKEDVVLMMTVRDPHTKSWGILDMKIPVKVEPDLNLPALWLVNNPDNPGELQPALDYNGKALVRLLNTQKSTTYRLFLKMTDGTGPAESETWMSRPLRGTDGDLDLQVTGTLTEDVIVGIVVWKAGSLPEAVLLKAELIIPVKPQLITKLSLQTSGDGENIRTSIQLTGAQCGVIYQLYRLPNNKPVGEPVFYHRNLGIGNMRVGSDYIADHYRVKYGMTNWVNSQFVIGDAGIEDNKIIVLPAGRVKRSTTFYVIAKKSTTGFTEQLPPITVTID